RRPAGAAPAHPALDVRRRTGRRARRRRAAGHGRRPPARRRVHGRPRWRSRAAHAGARRARRHRLTAEAAAGYGVEVGQQTDRVTPAAGLTSAEVAERVGRGDVNTIPEAPTRTTNQIIRANVFTPVNLVIGILAGLVILAGSPKNALFAG